MLHPVQALEQQQDVDHRLLSDHTPPPSASTTLAPNGDPPTPPKKPTRKSASLARVAVPAYSAFRSQSSAAPVAVRSSLVPDLPPSSPRHFSFGAQPSPRLVWCSPRPLSVDSPQERKSQRHLRFPVRSSVHDEPDTSTQSRQHWRRPVGSGTISRPQTPPMSNNRLKPPTPLDFNGVQRSVSNDSLLSAESDKPPKSPSRLGALFGWKASSPQHTGTESPTTTFSEPSLSPVPSPGLQRPQKPLPSVPGGAQPRLAPAGLDVFQANSNTAAYLHSPHTPILLGTTEMNAHVQELERELAQVSAELANSIKREMDLEDDLDRMKLDHSLPPSEMSRRGSDYFSDSGAGSVRYPISDPDAKIQEEERLRRKAEQDRAQIKLDMAQKTQTELARRRDLEERVQSLEDQLAKRSTEGNEKSTKRVEDLEAQLEENRRRLNQEKEARANFEDLYTALQSELASGRKLGSRGFGSIAEDSNDYKPGTSRSASLARSGSMRGGSLNRSGSVKGRQRSGSNSAPVTAEGLQEVEDQRDALHKALKLLINRYDKQQKEHERHIKKVTQHKGLAGELAGLMTPGKSSYHREVSVLKEEVTTLRKRTEDALEQKWQYEKSLGGIKMDLDRAEHETRGLRDILQEYDILAPSPQTMQTATFNGKDSAKPLLSAAENDRKQARRLAEQFRKQAATLQQSGSAASAVAELHQAASRMDQLYQQFDDQVKTNTALHNRLSAAVEKGEREQVRSTRQIQDMQKKLAGMEDSLLAAQQHSEHTLNKHESQVRSIEESTSPRLHRFTLDAPARSPSNLNPNSPARTSLMRKSLKHAGKVQDVTLLDASRTQMLERQVRDLERSLRDAEDDMQHVVQRVNQSQIEVAELTNERDAAFMQMRKLQARLVQESERAEALMGGAKGRKVANAKGNDSGSDYGD